MNEIEKATEIVKYLEYDQNTGIFIWRLQKGRIRAGDVAGTVSNTTGYLQVQFDYKLYRLHRVAWLITYGKLPSNVIDHINGIRTDNRICNLRDVSISENNHNMRKPRKDSSTGFTGVSYDHRRQKYVAYIWLNSKKYHLGQFATPEQASQAYISAKIKMHKGYVNES